MTAASPYRILIAAIDQARAKGLVVRLEGLGVVCTSSAGGARWETCDDSVDPLGALLLMSQPPQPYPDEAAAWALGTSPLWLEGFGDGIARRPPSASWLRSPARQLAMHGFETGSRIRMALLAPARNQIAGGIQ